MDLYQIADMLLGRPDPRDLQDVVILVVEDDLDILSGLKDILEGEGYTVDTAETGREAIAKIKTRTHDLALINIKLTDMDGKQLLPVIDRENPGMIKIMLTGYNSLENKEKSLTMGAHDYLVKPIQAEILIALIKKKF